MSVTYDIENGIIVSEIKPVSNGNESLCKCPSCGFNKLYINKHTGLYECKRGCISGIAKEFKRKTPNRKQTQQKKRTYDEDTVDKYIGILVGSLVTEEHVRSYFLKKKIPISLVEKFQIGFSLDTPDYPDEKTAIDLGLLRVKRDKKTVVNSYYRKIVFPIKNRGKFRWVTGRSLGKEAESFKFIDITVSAGGKPLFNEDCLEKYNEIFICEGIPDALSLINAGYNNVVGILGAKVFKEEYSEKLSGKSIIIAYDNDEAGVQNAQRVASALHSQAKDIRGVVLPEGMDVCDYMASGIGKLEISPIEEIYAVSDRQLVHRRNEPNLAVFGFGQYEVHVSDIIQRRGLLKANVSVVNGKKMIATSNVDLNSAKSRMNFARDFSTGSGIIDIDSAKQAMVDLCGAIRQQLQQSREEEESPTARYIMDDKERETAIKFLSSPRLMYQIKQALDRQDIIGEDINKLLLYLVYTSRLMAKPISALIKGPSSSGKTWLMNRVLTLIPREGHIAIQDASAKTFYYVEENELKHKMIIIGEMHGAEASNYSIRELQDGVNEGGLVIMTVEKNPETLKMETSRREIQGPCGFVSSTTDVGIHAENETRNFSIYVRIDEKKVRETDVVLSKKYEGKSNNLNPEEVLLFHNAQRCLQTDLEVRIPYVRFVLRSFPTSPIRVMRDRSRFFVLIETIAILHQFQRKIYEDKDNNKKWIVATIADYNIAVKLMKEILVETIYEFPAKSKEIYNAAIELREKFVKDFKDETILNPDDIRERFFATYKQLSDIVKLKPAEVRRWSKPLFDAGYFEYYEGDEKSKKGGRGRQRISTK